MGYSPDFELTKIKLHFGTKFGLLAHTATFEATPHSSN